MVKLSHAQKRQLARDNAARGRELQDVPQCEWPAYRNATRPLRVLRSSEYLVQIYNVGRLGVVCRITVCRTSVRGDRWADQISWDELQRIKGACGYGAHDAVEVYPPDVDVVNVANMRHLWVLAQPLLFAWRAREKA